MRQQADCASHFVLVLAVLAFTAAPCARGQQAPVGVRKAPEPAAKAGTVSQVGKQAAKDSAQDPPADSLAGESTQLLRLATELKAEIDKTNKDVLSIAVIRKADAIERMAHGMRGRVKAEAGVQAKEKP